MGAMIWLVLAVLIALALAAVVVGLVAVPAHREGRAMLTERGEQMGRGATSLVTGARDKLGRKRQTAA